MCIPIMQYSQFSLYRCILVKRHCFLFLCLVWIWTTYRFCCTSIFIFFFVLLNYYFLLFLFKKHTIIYTTKSKKYKKEKCISIILLSWTTSNDDNNRFLYFLIYHVNFLHIYTINFNGRALLKMVWTQIYSWINLEIRAFDPPPLFYWFETLGFCFGPNGLKIFLTFRLIQIVN